MKQRGPRQAKERAHRGRRRALDAPAQPVTEPAASAAGDGLRHKLVLFVEHRASPSALQAALARAGCEVTRVAGFLDAITCLVQERPSVFVVRLPSNEFVGNALIAEARRAVPAVPIVVIGCARGSRRHAILERLGVASALGAGVASGRVVETVLGVLRCGGDTVVE